MTKSKRDKVQRLLKLFDGDHQVYIDGAKAEKVQVSEAVGMNENQVVYLVWREDNQTFGVIITEAGLADAELRETAMELEDHEGEPVTLEFHRPSGIVPIATLFRDQPPMTDPLPEATIPNREDLKTSNRSILLQAEQARKILRVLTAVPDQPGAREAISLLEELLADSEERRVYVAAAREKHASDERALRPKDPLASTARAIPTSFAPLRSRRNRGRRYSSQCRASAEPLSRMLLPLCVQIQEASCG